MKSRFGILLCTLAILQIQGGHWAVLQTTAWVGMVIQYSHRDGIAAGVTETFDGAHPCSMCRAIKTASSQEQKKAPLFQAEFKKDFLAEENGFQVQPTWTELTYSLFDEHSHSLVFRPALPPPRTV